MLKAMKAPTTVAAVVLEGVGMGEIIYELILQQQWFSQEDGELLSSYI